MRKNSQRPVPEERKELPVVRNPDEILSSAFISRQHDEGITVDGDGTRLIDDGFWIEQNKRTGGWTVKTYIADVPALIPVKSRIDQQVREQFQNPSLALSQETDLVKSFSSNFLYEYVSLRPGKARPAIAFTMQISKEGALESYEIKRKMFTSLHKCNHTPLQAQFNKVAGVANDWHGLAHTMINARLSAIADECDMIVHSERRTQPNRYSIGPNRQQTELLVQEMMRLTNAAASDYLRKHNLTVPFKQPTSEFNALFVSRDRQFDQVCDEACRKIMNGYSKRHEPKIRLSSPMRVFPDYITMQILARQLDGHKELPILKREAQKLTMLFREAAEAKAQKMRQLPWHTQFRKQGGEHPFDALTGHPGDRDSLALRDVARQRNWPRTDVAIRKIQVQGGYMVLVGMQQKMGDKSARKHDAVRSFGVALGFEAARELAAQRLLAQLPGTAPANDPGMKP